MKFRSAFRALAALSTIPFCVAVRGEEPFATNVIAQILQARDAIVASEGADAETSCVFLAFWDFDGTTLKGDCSEGLKDGGKTIYPGLAQVAIERGLSAIYPRDGGFEKFWSDYTNMDARIGHWLAYPFIPQMLRGARAADVLQTSREHFSSVMSNYLMASSVQIIRALERGDVQSHIISASADLFVKGASASVGIPENHIHGIEVIIRDGLVTEELVYPVTWNVGKLEKIKAVVAETERGQPGKKVFVLAGFGDSYNTDGPFLKFIATQKLPAGKPVAVFFNSKGEPDEYRGLFFNAAHAETVGENK